MKVVVGSKNPKKIEAIKEALEDYFEEIIVYSKDIEFDETNQPFSMDEVVKGAKFRAKKSFDNCDFSVGIESGLILVDEEKYLQITLCVIYDGKTYSIGCSSGFELPKLIIKLMKEKRLDLSEAVKEAGMTKEEKAGYGKGVINLFTKGKITRKDLIKEAATMSVLQLLNKEIYE